MPRMMRRPIRRVATMAVVGGGAYALGRSGGKSSAQKEAQPAAAAQQTTEDSKTTKLKELGELRSSGVLNDEEFTAEKKKILDS